jgi:uncharacterized protein
MKTGLDHLPTAKQRELEHIKTVLMSEFEVAIAGGTQPWRRNGKILKLILFGSFSRNDWVDEPQNGYQSDWDLLVVVSHEKLTDIADYWFVAEDKLLRDPKVRRPVNIIFHTMAEVNQALAKGRYFWVDIIRDGVLLYELPGYPLGAPMPPTAADAFEMAKTQFEHYDAVIAHRAETFEFQMGRGAAEATWRREAAFMLHQTGEACYACFLLVQTFHFPRSHNLKFLRSLAEDRDRRLIEAWPRETKLERRRFELLKRAYVEARYSDAYDVSADDLKALAAAVGRLRQIVAEVCRERIDELRRQAEQLALD